MYTITSTHHRHRTVTTITATTTICTITVVVVVVVVWWYEVYCSREPSVSYFERSVTVVFLGGYVEVVVVVV